MADTYWCAKRVEDGALYGHTLSYYRRQAVEKFDATWRPGHGIRQRRKGLVRMVRVALVEVQKP